MTGFGSSIKLEGESEYQRALKQINQSLREVGSEMKIVSSSFDKNDKSTQAMAQRSDVLNKKLEEQKNKLTVLTQKYNDMNNTYGKNSTAQKELNSELEKAKATLQNVAKESGVTSDAYKKQQKVVDDLEDKQVQYNNAVSKAKTEMNQAQAEVNKTTKELNDLEKELDDNNDELKKNEKGWSSWGQTLADLRTKAITGAINGLKKLGSAVISVGKQAISSYAEFEQLEGGAKKIFDELDFSKITKDANNAFKTLGLSANQYLEIMNTVGANFASTLGDKKGYEIAKEGLQAITDFATGTGKSVDELSTKYQMITRSTSSYLSIADQFAGILPQTTQGFLEQAQASGFLSDQYEKLTDVPVAEYQEALTKMLTKGVDGLGLLGNTAKEAETTLSGSLAMMKSAWQNLLTGLADGNQEMSPLIQNFVDSIGTAWENLKPRIRATIDGIKQAISEIWAKRGEIKEEIPELAPLINAFEWIINNKELVVGSITAILGAMVVGKIATFITTMVTLGTTLAGIPAVAGLASTAMTLLGGAFTFLTGPIGLIIAGITALVAGFMHLWKNSEDFRNFWMGLWEGLKNVVSTIIDTIVNIFNSFINFFAELPSKIGQFIQNIITFFQELPYNIGLLIGQALGHIIKFGEDAISWTITEVPNIINNVIKFFAELPSKIWDFLVSAFNKINEWGANVRNKAIEIGTNFVTNVINFISQLPSKIWNFLTNAISKVSEFATNIANKGKEGAKNLFDNIVNGIKELPSTVANIGKNIVEGLWNGIKNAGSWIKDKVKGFATGILDGMKSALGIKSPSKLFRDEVGKNIALGLGEGFSDEMKNVSSEMQNAIPTNFDINGAYNSSNGINTLSNYNSLVEAFTEALEGMKIELDDEEVGSFVKKTVENAIYN